MTRTTAIYAVLDQQIDAAHVAFAVARLAEACEVVLLVVNKGDAQAAADRFGATATIVETAKAVRSPLFAYQQGFAALRRIERDLPQKSAVLLTGSHVFGPIGSLKAALAAASRGPAVLWSSYWHNAQSDSRLLGLTTLPTLPMLDLAVLSAELQSHPRIVAFWETISPLNTFWDEVVSGLIPFATILDQIDAVPEYPISKERLRSTEPRLLEVDRVVIEGSPCFPTEVFSVDPLIHDLSAIDLRSAMDHLRRHEPDLYDTVAPIIRRKVPMRELSMICDAYQVVAEQAESPGKTRWAMGPVAVFIHAYYAEMMPEFWTLAERLPCEMHLFITTATETDRSTIMAFLAAKGLAEDAFTVRVVAHNRGRDMSSLFITWRDIVSGGAHEVALRLHSKRTPQVAPQVAEEFKRHLFENLVAGRGHVANILDRLEAEPDIGLVIPPVIHIGFGTLGQSWFNNRARVASLARQMGVRVPLDAHTPVAPYGTMFWFRTAALARMFEWTWRWEEYNEEPDHVDGGLAHAQERLIGYIVQDSGYRTLQVMTPRLAGRCYAKLEYKLQRIVAELTSANILDQVAEVSKTGTLRKASYRRLAKLYGKLIARWPSLGRRLRPVKTVVANVLSARWRL